MPAVAAEPIGNLRMRGRQFQDGETNVQYSILQTKKEAQSTRLISCVALLFAACSACSMYVLLRNSDSHAEFPEGTEVIRPGWAWTTVPAVVREEASMESTKVAVIPAKTRVLVSELRGVRARIAEPIEGWISCVSDGRQIVTLKEVDEELNALREKLLGQQKVQRQVDAALKKRKETKGVPQPQPRKKAAEQVTGTPSQDQSEQESP